MKKWMACALCSVGWLMAATAVAEPKDKSLAAWEKAQEVAKAKVEEQVKAAFANELQRIEDLKTKAYEIGEEVEVTIAKGRVRTVKGTFGGLQEKGSARYVMIGNTPYLLSDIDSRDRPLLLFGAKPEEREEFVKQEERRLESEMDRVRKMKLAQAYAKMGYDAAFMDNSLQIDGRFYTEKDLGLAPLVVRIEIPMGKTALPYAIVRIANPINRKESAALQTICILGLLKPDKDLMVFASTSENHQDPEDKLWVEYSCFLAKSDLGRQDPINRFAEKLRLSFANVDNLKATWQARVKRVRSGVRTNNGKQYWVADYKANLIQDSLGEADHLGMLRIQNAILRARSYQRDAAFEMKKKGVVLHGAQLQADEKTAPDAEPADAPAAAKKNP